MMESRLDAQSLNNAALRIKQTGIEGYAQSGFGT
jgi:hypothetical protein